MEFLNDRFASVSLSYDMNGKLYVHRFTYRDNPGINKNGVRFMVLMAF